MEAACGVQVVEMDLLQSLCMREILPNDTRCGEYAFLRAFLLVCLNSQRCGQCGGGECALCKAILIGLSIYFVPDTNPSCVLTKELM